MSLIYCVCAKEKTITSAASPINCRHYFPTFYLPLLPPSSCGIADQSLLIVIANLGPPFTSHSFLYNLWKNEEGGFPQSVEGSSLTK